MDIRRLMTTGLHAAQDACLFGILPARSEIHRPERSAQLGQHFTARFDPGGMHLIVGVGIVGRASSRYVSTCPTCWGAVIANVTRAPGRSLLAPNNPVTETRDFFALTLRCPNGQPPPWQPIFTVAPLGTGLRISEKADV